MRRPLSVALLAAGILSGADLSGIFVGGTDHPAIRYVSPEVHDPVAELNQKLYSGSFKLKFDGPSGFLRSVLDALDIPAESQMLVFSKTSLQAPLISPSNPRSIFFNDTTAVAWVAGEPFVEVASQDPRQGVHFYTVIQSRDVNPYFERRDSCNTCHESFGSLGVPGMMVRSVFPGPQGMPVRALGDYDSDHRSPFEHRWGGWYVSGDAGGAHHMGNSIVGDPAKEDNPLAPLAHPFDGAGGYLSPHSDIVALLVFEHQLHAMNLLTRIGWEVRYAQYEKRDTTALLRNTARELADYFLFVDEALLKGPVRGVSGFAEKFAARGPRDSRGRSLRELDLSRRLMRYRCSYMIYTAAFEGLPAEAKSAVYARLWEILSGKETAAKYRRLSAAERRAVIEILRETKPGLPDYFKAVAP
ncbi:MAG TPA: hypothetical protein VGF59_00585 [Bryobacteraceae bacterium]